MKTRVLVIGAGPAGLAAATRLLEEAPGRAQVKLIHMGHHLGGKAGSHREPAGPFVEHGWHMVLGFYQRLRALMERAGLDPNTLRSMGGRSHAYESWDGDLHTLDSTGGKVRMAARFIGYRGLPLADRGNYARFMSDAFLHALNGGELKKHDDVCFNTWAIERGLRKHVTGYSVFRFLREAYFNFPEQISAYHVLRSMELMSTSETAEAFVCRGPYSEQVWDPIGKYFESLGGTREPYLMATDFVYSGSKLTGVRVVRPDSAAHGEGLRAWSLPQVPAAAGSARVLEDFDYVISTVPVAVLQTMNQHDTRLWGSPYFQRLTNLRSAGTISMTAVTRESVLAYPGPVFGFPAPLGICVNMKPYWDEYRDNPQVGSVLDFVGQEAGFEGWSDQQVVDFTLDNFTALADVRAARVTRLELHRNRSDFERLMLCEPGVQQFRPGPRTPFPNLFFAGDWVRNEVDLICMEGAIASGQEAAQEVLARMEG